MRATIRSSSSYRPFTEDHPEKLTLSAGSLPVAGFASVHSISAENRLFSSKRFDPLPERTIAVLGGGDSAGTTERIIMKSHFFHLMPYKYLPENFAQKYQSV